MVKSELQIGQALLAATVAVYLVMFGLASLVSGPASDRFGRAPVYSFACVASIGSTLGCMLAPNITVLLACRALQGAVASALTITGYGVIADVVPPRIRGVATGVTTVVMALGMVAGPLVGGALAASLGWRSTFAALAILCVIVALALLLCIGRETHQYFVLQRLAQSDPTAAHAMQEWDTVVASPPKFEAPWIPIRHILQPDILPHALLGIVTWAVFSSVSNEALPTALAEAPYHLSAVLIGVALLADGIISIVANPLGGWMSDKFAARSKIPVFRIVPNTLVALALGPAGNLGAAWALHYHAHVAIVLVTVGIAGFGALFYFPALFSYMSTVRQSAPAAAISGVQGIMAVCAGAVVVVGALARSWLGYGWWLTALALLQLLVSVIACVVIYRQQARAAHQHATVNARSSTGEAPSGEYRPPTGCACGVWDSGQWLWTCHV